MGMIVKRHRFIFENENYQVVVRKNVQDLSLYDSFLYDDSSPYPACESEAHASIDAAIKEIKLEHLGIGYSMDTGKGKMRKKQLIVYNRREGDEKIR